MAVGRSRHRHPTIRTHTAHNARPADYLTNAAAAQGVRVCGPVNELSD